MALIEPQSVCEEIIHKLVLEYSTRYSLKEDISPQQFLNDTNRLTEELKLYHKSI
jgi:hypothetical protein